MLEVELKFLGIDMNEIEDKIVKLGAVKKYETITKNIYFDNEKLGFSFPSHELRALRLREIDGKNILTVKSNLSQSKMKVREEIELEIEDFDKMKIILEQFGFKSSQIFLKKRKHYELGNIHFEFDEIEGFPPYLEIETQSEKDMEEICKKLNINIKEGTGKSWVELFPESIQT